MNRKLNIVWFPCLLILILVSPIVSHCESPYNSSQSVMLSEKYEPREILVKLNPPQISFKEKRQSIAIVLPKSVEEICKLYGNFSSIPLGRTGESHMSGRIALDWKSATCGLFRIVFESDIPVKEVVKKICGLSGVAYAEPNYIGGLCSIPNDPYYIINQQALYSALGIEEAWGQTTGLSNVRIAVLDTGIDSDHPEFIDRIISGYNCLDGSDNTDDPFGHGTRVAGIIGAKGNDGVGITGICWNCSLIPIVVCGGDQLVTTALAVEAIESASNNLADVINISFDFSDKSQALESACRNAAKRAILVAAAGNEGQNLAPVYPAAYENVLAVAAEDTTGNRAVFSNFNYKDVNEFVDVAAPGSGIYTTILSGVYDSVQTVGTSFAAPIVSGLAALLKSKYPDQSPAAIINHIQQTCTPAGEFVKYGEINCGKALTTPMEPVVRITNCFVDDGKLLNPINDEDGVLDGGETAQITFTFENFGADLPDPIKLTLSSQTGSLEVDSSAESYMSYTFSQLLYGDSVNNVSPSFLVHVEVGAPQSKAELLVQIPGFDSIQYFLDIENEQVLPTSIDNDLTLSTDHTWVVSSNNSVVQPGAALTIDPGTTLKIDPESQLLVNGSLTAIGTQDSPIQWKSTSPKIQSMFEPMRCYGAGGYGSICIGEVNGDGILDVVRSLRYDYGVEINNGDGKGGFMERKVIGVPFEVGNGIDIGDISGDGYEDIVVSVRDYNSDTFGIVVLANDGDGNFSVSYFLPLEQDPMLEGAIHLEIADVNRDGYLDVISLTYYGIYVFLNHQGTLSTSLYSLAGYSSDNFVIGDVNNDADLDLVVVTPGGWCVNVLFGNGDGSFQDQIIYSFELMPYWALVYDIDNDDSMDVLVSGQGNAIAWLDNNENGSFTRGADIPVKSWFGSMYSADVSGDGLNDFIMRTNDSTIEIYTQKSNGGFNFESPFTNPVPNGSMIKMGYLNSSDNLLDVVCFNPESIGIGILLNKPNCYYPTLGLIDKGNSYYVDLNSDSFFDIIQFRNLNSIVVIKGNASGFDSPIEYPVGINVYDIAWGDVTRDNILDLVTANHDSHFLSLLVGNGDGTFQPARNLLINETALMVENVVIKDVLGDNEPDIVCSHYNGFTVFENRAGIDFSNSVTPSSPIDYVPCVTVDDFNNDGDNDVAIVKRDGGTIAVFPTESKTSFGTPIILTGEGWLHKVRSGDFDGDGFDDIISYGIYFQDANGNFSAPVGFWGSPYFEIYDVNQDGKDDIIQPGINETLSIIYGNESRIPIRKQYPIGNGQYLFANCNDFNNDGYTDISVSSSLGVSIMYGNCTEGFSRSVPSLVCNGTNTSLQYNKFCLPGTVNVINNGTITDCSFSDAIGAGFCAKDNVNITDCTTTYCLGQVFSSVFYSELIGSVEIASGPGYSFLLKDVQGQVKNLYAINNFGSGMLVQDVLSAYSHGNWGCGIRSSGNVDLSKSIGNRGIGIIAEGIISNSTSTNNLYSGLYAPNVTNSVSANNQNYGIIASGFVNGSTSIGNIVGIQSPTVIDCLVFGTHGTALSNTSTMSNSAVINNSSFSDTPILCSGSVIADNKGTIQISQCTGMYISGNYSGGVDGTEVIQSTLIGNHGNGVSNNVGTTDSNVVLNDGAGISGGSISNVFLYNNAEGDLTDGATGNTSETPVQEAPAFLKSVVTDRQEPIGVGLLNLTLGFSKPMANNGISVSLGQYPLCTTLIVEPQPGWISDTEWNGQLNISVDIEEGTHNLRISGAVSVDGFEIPPDTYHQLSIDPIFGNSVGSLYTTTRTEDSVTIGWNDPSHTDEVSGYAIFRTYGNDYTGKLMTLLATVDGDTSTFTDSDVNNNHFYKIAQICSNQSAQFNYCDITKPTLAAPSRPPEIVTPKDGSTIWGTEVPIEGQITVGNLGDVEYIAFQELVDGVWELLGNLSPSNMNPDYSAPFIENWNTILEGPGNKTLRIVQRNKDTSEIIGTPAEITVTVVENAVDAQTGSQENDEGNNETWSQVTTNEEAIVSVGDSTAEMSGSVEIPSTALAEDTQVSVELIPNERITDIEDPILAANAIAEVKIELSNSQTLLQPILLTISYPDANDDGFVDNTNPPVNENDIVIVRINNDGTYESLSTTVYPVDNLATAQIDHLSSFVLANPPQPTPVPGDTTPPGRWLNGPAEMTLECCRDSYTEFGVTATDQVDPNVEVTITGSVNTQVPGTYVVTYNVIDASGNRAQPLYRTVIVQDTTPPEISCNIIKMVSPDPGQCSQIITWETPVAYDLCDPYPSVSCSPESGSTFPKGDSTITCTAIDKNGNSSTCQFTVIVNDNESPQIVLDQSSIVVVDSDCSGNETVTLPEVTVSDNCDLDPTITCDAPTSFTAGETTTVNYTAKDEDGNVSTASVDVIVLYGAQIIVKASKHTVGPGQRPGCGKEPLGGILIGAYDMSRTGCARVDCGGISHHQYQCILDNCEPVNTAYTDEHGEAIIDLPPGEYILISGDATKTVLPDPLGVSEVRLMCGDTKITYLHQIIKRDGKKVPAKTKRLTGTELLIIEPEYIVWDDEVQLYPFIFESVGDWGVAVSVEPPEGFETDTDSLSALVSSEIESLQFTITEVGSDLVQTKTQFEIKHKGKKSRIQSNVDLYLTPDYARSRGFNVKELRARGLIKEQPSRHRPRH